MNKPLFICVVTVHLFVVLFLLLIYLCFLFSEDDGNKIGQQTGSKLGLDPWWIALICLIAILLIVFIVIVMCTMNKDEDLKSKIIREYDYNGV